MDNDGPSRQWRSYATGLIVGLLSVLLGGTGVAETSGDAGSASGRDKASGRSETNQASVEQANVTRLKLRDPVEVRKAPDPFSGDLAPIGKSLARKLLHKLCPAGPEKSDGESSDEKGWYCPVCPAFTSKAGQKGEMRLERFVRGDFLKEGKKEVFATYRGCEPKNAAHGGGVIFRKRKGKWEARYRHPGFNPQQCLKFEAKKDQDRLVCRLRFESKGRVIDKIVDASGGRGGRTLVRSLDNTGRCPTRKFISSYLMAWKQADVNEDGTPDLVVEKIQRWKPLGKKNKKRICRLDQAGGKWNRVRKYDFEFHFNGHHLRRRKRQHQSLLAGQKQAKPSKPSARKGGESEEESKQKAD